MGLLDGLAGRFRFIHRGKGRFGLAVNLQPKTAKRGAGLSGLTAAAALGQAGWSVRVHERNDELRELGAGILIWENGIWALKQVGAFEDATRGTDFIKDWELRDEHNRTLQHEWMLPGVLESYAILRTQLHQALAKAAERVGAEIVTSSPVASANADGELILASGETCKADLVIGADGINSRVRESVGLVERVTDLRDGCGRHLIERKPSDIKDQIIERWNREHEEIRLRTATVSEWFAALPEHGSQDYPSYQVAWPDSWAHGLGSCTARVAQIRRSQRRRADVEALVEHAQTPRAAAYFARALEEERMALEHTFGAWSTTRRPTSWLNNFEQNVKELFFHRSELYLNEAAGAALRTGPRVKDRPPTLYAGGAARQAGEHLLHFTS